MIPELWRQRQVDFCALKGQSTLHREFQAKQSYILRACLIGKAAVCHWEMAKLPYGFGLQPQQSGLTHRVKANKAKML